MIALERVPDWPERLIDVIGREQARAFAWGAADCGTLFADAVMAMTGVDPLERLRPWDSELTALIRLYRAKVRSVAEYLDGQFARIAPAQARRGDAGYASDAGPLSCPAIVLGAEAVSRDTAGWVVLPRTCLVAAYRIG